MTVKKTTLSLPKRPAPTGVAASASDAAKPKARAPERTPQRARRERGVADSASEMRTERTPRPSTTSKERLFTPRGTKAEDRFEAAKAHARGSLNGSNAPQAAKPNAGKTQAAPSNPEDHDGKIRLSKLMSEQGICSRREADSYIVKGWVFVDGERISELGTRVAPTAKIKLDRQAEARQASRVTVLIHKPIGYVSGQAEDGYQPASVLVVAEKQVESDAVRFRPEHRRGLAPAGRLDIDSTGLLVLTEDGRVAKHLIGEDSPVEKEYLVRVEGELAAAGLALLNHGLELDGEQLKPAKVVWQNEDQLRFILTEGKKRQIRRMCELVGLKVVGLKRIRIGQVKLGDLPMGQWRFLRPDENF